MIYNHKLPREYNTTPFASGDRRTRWIANGRHHCEYGPALITDRVLEIRINGKRHSTTQPAVVYSTGDQHWFVNGELHRHNGPAIEYANGRRSWFWKNNKYKFATWCQMAGLADADCTWLILQYGINPHTEDKYL